MDWSPEGIKYDYNEHMAFYARSFWKDPAKAKEQLDQRTSQVDKRVIVVQE